MSADLRRQALFALFYAILGTVVYLSGRFEAKWGWPGAGSHALCDHLWYHPVVSRVSPTILIIVALVVSTVFGLVLDLRYALAAIIAIYHDVLVTVGFSRCSKGV